MNARKPAEEITMIRCSFTNPGEKLSIGGNGSCWMYEVVRVDEKNAYLRLVP